jgi:hypothetical protein
LRPDLSIGSLAAELPAQNGVAAELMIGRALAIMRHPVLAWPRLRPLGRAVLAAGYAGVSYLTAILALLALSR